MITETPRVLVEIDYDKAAREHLRRLPPEHFMEATPQATQRKITLENLDLVKAQRPDVHVSTNSWCNIRCRAGKGRGRWCRTTWLLSILERWKWRGATSSTFNPPGRSG